MPKSPKHLAPGVEYWQDEQTLLLIRPPHCNKENYAPAVATGRCIWCGYDARQLIDHKNKQ